MDEKDIAELRRLYEETLRRHKLDNAVWKMIEALQTYENDPSWSVGDWMREEQTYQAVADLVTIPFDGSIPIQGKDDHADELEQAFALDRGRL